jgi:hypothetical protein
MQTLLEANLNGRERKKLRQAWANGYLDARGAGIPSLLLAFSLWCRRLGLPLVWCERNSPYARYGRVTLELWTACSLLNVQGQAAVGELMPGAVEISPHGAQWSRVPLAAMEELAGCAMKAAVRAGNSEAAAPRLFRVERRHPARVIELPKVRTAPLPSTLESLEGRV